MTNKVYIVFIGSLLFLVGCSTNEKKTSALLTQTEILTQFNASLHKIVSLEGQGIDTVVVPFDSVSWKKELQFLSYIDLLDESRFVLDSSKNKIIYTPRENKCAVVNATLTYKGKEKRYAIEVVENNLVKSFTKKVDARFSVYEENEPVLSSYVVSGIQKSSFSDDSVVFKVEAKVTF